MSALLDPTGQPLPPPEPNMHDVPCECGYVNRVEIHPPRFYNLRQTSMVVAEHAGPFMCAGCIRLVTPCVVSFKDVIFVCQPVTRKPTLAGAPQTTVSIPVEGESDPPTEGEDGSATIEVPITDPSRVM